MGNILISKFAKKSNELLIILAACFIFAIIAFNYNLFVFIITFVNRYDSKELGGLLTFLIYVSFVTGVFSIGHWMKLGKNLTLYTALENGPWEKDKVYRALFEQSNDAIIISDGKKIFDMNKKCREIFGSGQESSCDVSLISLIPGKCLPELQQSLKEIFRQDYSFFEMRHIKSDGNVIEMEVSISLIDRMEKIIQIVARDVTDRKNAERMEEESREKLKATLDNTFCGILLIEASTRKIVDANPVALRAAGYSEKELLEKACHKSICRPENEMCAAPLRNQAGDLSESVFLKIRGEPLPILRSIVPVSIGGKGYFVESFLDISECRKTEQESLQEKMKVEGANYP
jgi:PAS domain S-box-containing protein